MKKYFLSLSQKQADLNLHEEFNYLNRLLFDN